MERTITGEITKWTDVKPGFKKDNTPYARISCMIDGEWHGFFAPTPKDLNRMKENYPEGFVVTFVEWKGKEDDKYWNYKKGTLKADDGSTVVKEEMVEYTEEEIAKMYAEKKPDKATRTFSEYVGVFTVQNGKDHPTI